MKRGAPICLVIPPSAFLLDERVFMALGILRVAAVLEQHGHAVEVLDLSGIQNFADVVRLHAESTEADVFGITATTPQMPAAMEVVNVLRHVRPQARIVLGGPHVTLVNAAFKNEVKRKQTGRAAAAYRVLETAFDVLVAGDGDDAIFEAIRPAARKLIDADDPKSSLFLTNARYNELPFPARHLVDVASYHYAIEGVRALSLIAQLGCPFACGFCGGRESPMLRRIRTRDSRKVIAEMREMYQSFGVRGFMMYDDELNVSPRMVELMNGLSDLQAEVGADFRLRGFIKSELFTDEQAAAMARAGFRWILVGFESGAHRILQNINKRATRDDNTRCIEIARRHGLKVKALMSLGHPGESNETIAQTHDWLLEVRPDDFDVTIITTYPGTPYYDHAQPSQDGAGIWTYTYEKTGDRLFAQEVDYTKVADYYKGDPDGGYHAYVYTDYLSSDELVALRDAAERDVRAALRIPFNPAGRATRFEHSMGQFALPASILRITDLATAGRNAT